MVQFDWRDLRPRELNDAPPTEPARRGVRTKCVAPSSANTANTKRGRDEDNLAAGKEGDDAHKAKIAKEEKAAQAVAEAKEAEPDGGVKECAEHNQQ